MAPVYRSRPLNKSTFPTAFKSTKTTLYNDTNIPVRPGSAPPAISAISWSPAGSLIASCSHALIRIWSPDKPNIKSSTELRNAHPKPGIAAGSGLKVEKVAFSPSTENVLASSGGDGVVRLWDVRVAGGAATSGKGTPLASCHVGSEGQFLTWRPDGLEMLVGRKNRSVHRVDVRRIDAVEGLPVAYEAHATDCTPIAPATAEKSRYTSMAYSNSGREIFATTEDGAVRIFDAPTMTRLHTLHAHAAPSYAVQASPNGSVVAVGAGDGLVSVWDTTTWHCAHTLATQRFAVRELSFSFDGTFLVTGHGEDAKVGEKGLDVWHVDLGEQVHTIETSHPIAQVAWHPLRYWIAYAGDPGGLKIVGMGGSV